MTVRQLLRSSSLHIGFHGVTVSKILSSIPGWKVNIENYISFIVFGLGVVDSDFHETNAVITYLGIRATHEQEYDVV